MRPHAYCKKLPNGLADFQVPSLAPVFYSAVGFIEPTAAFYFCGFSCLSAACPLFVRYSQNIALGGAMRPVCFSKSRTLRPLLRIPSPVPSGTYGNTHLKSYLNCSALKRPKRWSHQVPMKLKRKPRNV